ncbi:MAG TPA: RNA polymerase sigma factor, partial [Blastocatellia bacterium]|nr:RNA polymerase sigma factor [Blastocatellia bacterium]
MQRTQQRPPLTAPDHEELFIKRYERLLGWALRLTGGSRPAAEDLVHDVYVQFMLGGCDLKSIHNLDGYLRRSLLNLFLAQQRQATKMQNVSINVINYESIEIGLLAIDSQTRWQVQEALLQVCQYACRRKESSRAGSVLILRFFYDYTPGEIARVIGSPRRAVDDWLRIARREARLHLEDPTRLKFMSGRPAGRLTTILAESPDSLIREIRATIAWSRQGPCLSPERLRELYGGPEASPLDCATLSHLVSCPGCLDRANHWLGLPPLADRYSGGRPGPGDEGPGAGGTDAQPGGAASAGGDAPPEALIKTLRRRLQQVIEHRPEELQLASNGSPIGRLKLTSELSEFQLHLRDQAPIEFIEVFSERNVRLLLFSIEPDGSAPEQQTRIELSDGRSLEAIFKNEAPWPSLRIIYHDPLLAAAAADCPSISDPPDLRSPWRRRFGRVKRRRESPSILAVPKTRFRLRPGLVAAALSIMLVAGLLYLQSRSTRVTAAGLLHRARAAEESIAPGLSVLRTLDLEERSLPDGRIVMRRRIRIRQDGKSGLRVRRLYDEQQHLIAGEWITNLAAAASRTIYRRGQSPRTEPATRDPQAALRDRELWRLEPSARLYEELIGRPDLARATELPETYVINFEQPETDPASARLLKATLTLRKTDLHAVEQTLLVRIIDEGQPQWREFRFSESGFERQQPSTVAPEEFKPEPELLGAGEHGGRAANSIATPSTLVVSASAPSASPELEVEVLSLLHRVNADLNEPVTITRAADGALRIEALTETAERKAEILAALQPVINHPAV